MKDKNCPCGGTLFYMGEKLFHEGKVVPYVRFGYWTAEYQRLDMYACGRCGEVRLFLPEGVSPQPDDTARIQQLRDTLSGYSDEKLKAMAESKKSTDAARELAGEILAERGNENEADN